MTKIDIVGLQPDLRTVHMQEALTGNGMTLPGVTGLAFFPLDIFLPDSDSCTIAVVDKSGLTHNAYLDRTKAGALFDALGAWLLDQMHKEQARP